ncbi:MAG: hypothetical protein HQ492_05100 [Woeseiaceae bacterium]|nr:hypothetical protein [Woeseiaceae bacterium]
MRDREIADLVCRQKRRTGLAIAASITLAFLLAAGLQELRIRSAEVRYANNDIELRKLRQCMDLLDPNRILERDLSGFVQLPEHPLSIIKKQLVIDEEINSTLTPDIQRFVDRWEPNSKLVEYGRRLYVYSEGDDSRFMPTGLMPGGDGIGQNTKATAQPQDGTYHMHLEAQLSLKDWVGCYMLLNGQWEPTTRMNLMTELHAKNDDIIRCRFWARSNDSAVVKFKVGGVTIGKVQDSLVFPVSTSEIKLTPNWTLYEIDLTDMNLSSVVGAFCWVAEQAQNGRRDISFDLDNIYIVKLKPPGTGQRACLPVSRTPDKPATDLERKLGHACPSSRS